MVKKTAHASTKIRKLNETGNRKQERRKTNSNAVAQVERRKVQRRRQIDPTTCEREYSEQEIDFMRAMDEYKRISGRMFPTCSEILEVITNLGYRQIAPAQQGYMPKPQTTTGSQPSVGAAEPALSFQFSGAVTPTGSSASSRK
jgi:hypothetical protein